MLFEYIDSPPTAAEITWRQRRYPWQAVHFDLPQRYRLARLQIQFRRAGGLLHSLAKAARALPGRERVLVERLRRAGQRLGGAHAGGDSAARAGDQAAEPHSIHSSSRSACLSLCSTMRPSI